MCDVSCVGPGMTFTSPGIAKHRARGPGLCVTKQSGGDCRSHSCRSTEEEGGLRLCLMLVVLDWEWQSTQMAGVGGEQIVVHWWCLSSVGCSF